MKSRNLAFASVMGALAVVISLMRLQVPFPLLFYLKFDLAEVPSFITFYLAGLYPSILCAFLHFLGLLVRGSSIFGSSMKFAAVASNLLGIGLVRKSRVAGLLGGCVSRVAVMSVINFVTFSFLFPNYMDFSMKALEAAGINVSSRTEAFIIVLALIAAFNTIHALLSSLAGLAIVEAIKRRLPSL